MSQRLFVVTCAVVAVHVSVVAATLAPPAATFGEPFATSPVCAMCHSNSPNAAAMRRPDGGGVAPFDVWGSSMMAHAARDPLFHAVMSAEIAATPSRRADIEASCLRCHAPLAPGITRRELAGDDDRARLGLDGASCTVCHGMRPDGLGSEASFSGGFRIRDDGHLHGPHADPFPMPMQRHTGYTPVHENTVLDPAACATCHTLYTEAIAPDGNDTGIVLPEQTPYLEWRASAFGPDGATPTTCQACHMPVLDDDGRAIVTAIARNPGGFDFGFAAPRRPFGRHQFVGGNTLVPAWLDLDRDRLRPLASSGGLRNTTLRAEAFLANRTADLAIGDPAWSDAAVEFPVHVTIHTGHRFPTAHPTRRAWLAVRVVDAAGEVVFESGGFDDRGRILGPDGDALPSERAGGPIVPARTTISSADEVALYESVMADVGGQATFLLTRGATYLKDSRLSPRGANPTLEAGGDTVTYRVPLASDRGALTVRATLLYQTLGARWEAELLRADTPEVRALASLLDRHPSAPVQVAAADTVLQPVSPAPGEVDRGTHRTAGHPSSRP